jgi:(4S)-4-hydroxy-5-phosphonooxypentane-2,3-dione isomerase
MSMSADYVVVVDLRIDGDALPAFMALLWANARASLSNEAGCRRFDICVDPADPRQVLLYEIYDDGAAFAAHLASEHYLRFDADTRHMIAGKSVRKLALRAG